MIAFLRRLFAPKPAPVALTPFEFWIQQEALYGENSRQALAAWDALTTFDVERRGKPA